MIFGRKRYLARQQRTSEQLAESYRWGCAMGYQAFQRGEIVAEYPNTARVDRRTTAGAFTLGWLKGWESAQWEWEDETTERLEALGAEVVAAAEAICAEAVGIDLGSQDIHGGDEA